MARPRKLYKDRLRKTGHAPGSLMHIGEVKTDAPAITLIEYDNERFRETHFKNVQEGKAYQPDGGVYWLNVHGLHEPDIMGEIGRRFDLHPLTLEDILNTDQRPKLEDYGHYLYIVARLFDCDAQGNLMSDQISLVVGRNWVLTFQERPTGKLNDLRQRLKAGTGQLRKLGADYLAYSILDAIVDYYFVVLERVNDATEHLEDELWQKPSTKLLPRIHMLKSDTLLLKKSLWPLRELFSTLARGEHDLFSPETRLYLRDVYDHTVHVIESTEVIRDLISGMQDIYLSALSNRLNVEMRFLTAVTTIFLPLTLITGIYGMNFKYMPELEWHWGYFAVLGALVLIAGVMGFSFWRRRWL
ncbi:magnesium transporter [Chitinivorax tropicus]|uniref:Magnesium transport protein CorA n=1 Tax=Chitinivorax tropicus TaxID=714531 RepID=A0A840MJA8_9PROT|nr:magnesium/cobalt transporter CorA [Chitinivorax tropicus]MBB5017269.1 magnesium transporter [Chitinivorax tropicus]